MTYPARTGENGKGRQQFSTPEQTQQHNPYGPKPGRHTLMQQHLIPDSFARRDSIFPTTIQGKHTETGQKSGHHMLRPDEKY
jgi:hypothetical protein